MTWQLQEKQVILPRLERGCDYGTFRFLLLQRGSKRLEWRPGSSVWNGGAFRREWSPARLVLTDEGLRNPFHLFDGRFGANRLTEAVRKDIARWMGVGPRSLPEDIRLRSTYLWVP